MARPSDRHESASRPPVTTGIPPVFGEVWEDLKKQHFKAILQQYAMDGQGLRRGPTYLPTGSKNVMPVAPPPPRALSKKAKGQHLMYRPPVESQDDETATSPSPLTKGTKGLFILQGVCEGVLEKRKLEEV